MSGLPASFRGAGSTFTPCARAASGMATSAAPASNAAFASRLFMVLALHYSCILRRRRESPRGSRVASVSCSYPARRAEDRPCHQRLENRQFVRVLAQRCGSGDGGVRRATGGVFGNPLPGQRGFCTFRPLRDGCRGTEDHRGALTDAIRVHINNSRYVCNWPIEGILLALPQVRGTNARLRWLEYHSSQHFAWLQIVLTLNVRVGCQEESL